MFPLELGCVAATSFFHLTWVLYKSMEISSVVHKQEKLQLLLLTSWLSLSVLVFSLFNPPFLSIEMFF